MELTAARLPDSAEPAFGDVLDVIRRSCSERAAADALVDEAGIVGVRSGAAPLLWVTSGASPRRLAGLVRRSPEIHELYVDVRNRECVDALARRGWRVREVMAHMATGEPGVNLAALPAGHVVRAASDPDVPLVRDLIGAAFALPSDVRDAAYPDDFLVRAAPVQLFVAEQADGLVGSVAVRRQGEAAMVFGLAVADRSRRKGLSRILVSHAVGAAIGGGAEFVHALTSDVTTVLATSMGWSRLATWAHMLRDDAARD